MTTAFAERTRLLTVLLAGCLAFPVLAADRKPIPIPSAPEDKTYTSLRDVQYCEVWLFQGTPEEGIAGVYFNTSDLNNLIMNISRIKGISQVSREEIKEELE